ncbi:hypothetical protein [Pseudonocardia sp.]|uniref:hypothetical protein n=1 Tax=Pseudonocardia sp. TaxID=60912 RepID=UPI0026077650|nr:hypothetical protein [Pseudonocardia sp.]
MDEKLRTMVPINNPKHANMPEERRCRGHKKNGDRCQRPSILGATVCRHHGGAAGHVKRAAKARLENAADRMAALLLGIAEDTTMKPETRLAAIRDALDRAGLSPRQALDVVHDMKKYEQIFDGIDRGAIDGPTVVEGEIVSTDFAEWDDGRTA